MLYLSSGSGAPNSNCNKIFERTAKFTNRKGSDSLSATLPCELRPLFLRVGYAVPCGGCACHLFSLVVRAPILAGCNGGARVITCAASATSSPDCRGLTKQQQHFERKLYAASSSKQSRTRAQLINKIGFFTSVPYCKSASGSMTVWPSGLRQPEAACLLRNGACHLTVLRRCFKNVAWRRCLDVASTVCPSGLRGMVPGSIPAETQV